MRLCGRAGFQIAGWSITASQAGHCSNMAGREVVNTKKKKRKTTSHGLSAPPTLIGVMGRGALEPEPAAGQAFGWISLLKTGSSQRLDQPGVGL